MIGFFQPIIRDIGQMIAKEASRASMRSLPDIISISITVILTLIAMVGAVVTAYMYLAEYTINRHAMLIVTLSVVFLAIVSGLVAKKIIADKTTHEEVTTEANQSTSNQNEMVAALGMEAVNLVGKHPKNAALIAMAVGVSMGVSPELRKAVFEQFLPKS